MTSSLIFQSDVILGKDLESVFLLGEGLRNALVLEGGLDKRIGKDLQMHRFLGEPISIRILGILPMF
jgi:hypothetical protein